MQLGQVGNLGNLGRQRVEAVVRTLAALGCRGESMAEVAHDARNMVTALGLYCDLLEEPGVLAVPFAHYGSELRLVAAASRRLVEKLVALDTQWSPDAPMREIEFPEPVGRGEAAENRTCLNAPPDRAPETLERSPERDLGESFDPVACLSAGRSTEVVLRRSPEPDRHWETTFAKPVTDLAAELLANCNLLSALAGPGIAVTVDTEGGARAARLSAEDLTRLLVNIVKNAAEALPSGGRIQISLRERRQENAAGEWMVMAIEDSGAGIAPSALDRIFDSGFTTRARSASVTGGWPAVHRGLGLAISRSIVESAGGRISASNGAQGGARFEIELPVRTP